MIQPLAERLIAQFYEWEILGRGWLLGKEPVELEPPFTPFFGHFSSIPQVKDDGIRHTVLSRVASLFNKKPDIVETVPAIDINYEPYRFTDDNAISTLRLIIPKKFTITQYETEQFLTMLSYCTSPISFEIIATYEKIIVQFSCRETYLDYLRSQLKTYFSEVAIVEELQHIRDYLEQNASIATVDFGLKEEFMRPLALGRQTHLDSLAGLFSILEHLGEDEQVIVQVLFNGVVNQWAPSMLQSVTNRKQEAFFVDAPEMLPMTKEKISSPLFAVTLRTLTQADQLDDAFSLLHKLSFAITTASRSPGNSLVPLSDERYTFAQRLQDICWSESHRLGMLLNVKELATFVHIPTAITSKKLFNQQRKTKAAPSITDGHRLTLGINEHEGIDKTVTLSNEQRVKHCHIIGATGTGKSTLLQHMIVQDIEAGNGIAILDPHGDLIDKLLYHIPEERMQDVIILDPSDSEYPVGFNILHAHSDIEKEVLSSDLIAAFKRLSTSWGDQMNSVFANAILAFLESSRGGTLADLRRFLIEKTYRDEFLTTVKDPNIIYYWQKEYSILKTNSIGSILTRLDSFLRPRLIRNMVTQKKSLDFENIMDTKKILLVKLSQGLIGNENSYLLGTFVVSKIHQAAFARQAKQSRNDFFFYIDEFQYFITPSMAAILSGARKYHVGLVLAHQDMQQLQKYDNELAASVIANAYTRICFRVGETDAKKLAEGFSFFEAQDLQNLSTGEAIVRVEKPEFDFSLSTTKLGLERQNEELRQKIITSSRNIYAASREMVEERLTKNLWVSEEEREGKRKPEFEFRSKAKEENQKSKEETAQEAVITHIQPLQTLSDENETVQKLVRRKEESQHRYLQNLIKKMAESRGYRATSEAATPDGLGKVDVLIEGNELQIACEISVTTDASWEIHNIEKCLAAGYSEVVSCVTDTKAIGQLQKKIQESFTKDQLQRIKVMDPEALFGYFDSIVISSMQSEETIKGYRVKVSYDSISEEEMKRKRESVARIVAESLRKIKSR